MASSRVDALLIESRMRRGGGGSPIDFLLHNLRVNFNSHICCTRLVNKVGPTNPPCLRFTCAENHHQKIIATRRSLSLSVSDARSPVLRQRIDVSRNSSAND